MFGDVGLVFLFEVCFVDFEDMFDDVVFDVIVFVEVLVYFVLIECGIVRFGS